MPFHRLQKESLDIFEDIMNDRSQNYLYTGSAAMAIHGIDIYPSDIDVVVGEDTFDEINRLFPDEQPERVGRKPYRGMATGAAATVLNLDIGTTEFEIMKDSEYHLDGENFNLEDCEEENIDYGGRELNVIALEGLSEIYEAGGRYERADTIKEHIGRQQISDVGNPRDPLEYLELKHSDRE